MADGTTPTPPATPPSNSGSQAATYLIKIDGKSLASTVDGYNDYGLLYLFNYNLTRNISADAAGGLNTNAQVQTTPLSISITDGPYVADMETMMVNGEPLPKITIIKLANIGGTNQMVDQTIFETNYITSFKPNMDPNATVQLSSWVFRFNKITHTVFQYKQDGTLLGQNESAYDFSTNKAG